MNVEEIQYDGKTYVTVDALADRTGYDAEYLRKIAKAEKVDAIQIGASRLINPEDLERYQAEYPSRGPREEWLRRNEFAKSELVERMAKHGKTFAIHWFRYSAPEGFVLFVTCKEASYEALVSEIIAAGLASDLRNVRKGDGAEEYEIFVHVFQDWEPPKRQDQI